MRISQPTPATPVFVKRFVPALVLTLAVLSTLGGCAAGGGATGVEYSPPAAVERLSGAGTELSDAALILDFDASPDRLYLLERWGRVLVLGRDDGEWVHIGAFGRRGSGPGEFENPTGIAVVPGGILVAEPHRLQLFSEDGAHVSSHRLELPCAMAMPAVAAAVTGLFVHGNCVRHGYVTDTMMAVLAWSPDTSRFRAVAEEVRFTMDGGIGSVFGASRALGTGSGGRHLFGGGTANCITVVESASDTPALKRICPAVSVLYRAEPPPALERRLQAGIRGVNVIWPATLPAYIERVPVGDVTVLLRPFSTDSVVLQTAWPDSRDLAVAPLDGLVGCRAGGCLWVFENAQRPYAYFLEATRLHAMLLAAGGAR
jgi:hypothetical protein